jgi:hypothetical protein
MEQDVKIQTLIIMSVSIFIILAAVAFLIEFETETARLFFLVVAAALTAINVFGFFMVLHASPTIIDEMFLMTPTGMLLKHYTRRLRPDQDADILAGMLTAVQNFVRESFEETGGRLKEIRFESYDILLTYSKNVVLAAVISTKKPEKLRNQLKAAASDLEAQFGERISRWSGDRSDLVEIDAVMKKLISGKYRSK